MTETCANIHYLRQEEILQEAQEIFAEHVDRILDDWWESKEELTPRWDDLLDAMLNPPEQFIEAIANGKGELLIERMRLLFRELYREEAVEYVRDN